MSPSHSVVASHCQLISHSKTPIPDTKALFKMMTKIFKNCTSFTHYFMTAILENVADFFIFLFSV